MNAVDAATRKSDIWILDVMRGLRTRFTFTAAGDSSPVWSPDGKWVVFSSNRKGHRDLYRKAVDGAAGSEELLYADDLGKTASGWSADGKHLLYTASPRSKSDIWVLPLDARTGEKKPIPFAHTEFAELQGAFSPDGHWIVYVSEESGRAEVYAAPFPGPGRKVQVSSKQEQAGSGGVPQWAPDGKEIFYIAPNRDLMAVEVRARGTELEVGASRKVLSPVLAVGGHNYEVSSANRVLAYVAQGLTSVEQLSMVQNWTAGLKH